MTTESRNQRLRERLNKKNSLRYEIKQKKNTLAKLSSMPEFLDEYMELKKEIETLETEYHAMT